MRRSAALGVVVLVGLAAVARAEEDPFSGIRQDEEKKKGQEVQEAPPTGIEVFTRNLKVGLEMIGRSWYADQDPDVDFSGALGVDLFDQLVTASGTWGTVEVQLRLFVDQNREFDFQPHNVYLEKRFLFGRLNLMAGHFQVPFGLEALAIDTHTPIVQLSNGRVLGFKHDWGVALRGQLTHLDYDLAYTIGSGMDPEFKTVGLFTGRLGWSGGADWLGLGLSATGGERLVSGRAVAGWKVGADLTHRVAFLRLMAEGSTGADEGERTLGFLLRLEAESPGGFLLGVAQYGVAEVLGPDGPVLKQRSELELAVRLLLVTSQSFFRINLALEEMAGMRHWLLLGQLYLRFES